MQKKFYSHKVILLLIILLAGFLRFYQLGSNPPFLTWDEVAWGYNAYSLGIDGKDEFGRFLPYDYFESFGDFKPPVYAYLTVLPIKIWGLNAFAVRFPSAFFGTLTVLITFFLVRRLFQKTKKSAIKNYADTIAVLSSFILAVSPWHIMLSRAAFEANIATFLLVTGVWLFLEGIQKRHFCLIFSAISFALSFYTFNTPRIVAPLLLFGLFIAFWKQLIGIKKITIIAVIVGFLLLLPTAKFLLSPQARLRFQEVNIFSDINVINTSNQEILNDNNAVWSKIIHNRRYQYGVNFVRHYVDNLSFKFLFLTGDSNPKFSTQNIGQMLLWELPFFIAGIIFLIRKREGNWWIIPFWLFVGIIPAATARETPHALRIEATLPTFQILVAYGVINSYIFFKEKLAKFQGKKLFVSCLILIILFNLLFFVEEYFVHYAKQFSNNWQYGYKDAISYAKKAEGTYDAIYFTQALGRPYIYLMFYDKIHPDVFRKEATVQRDTFGFVHVNSVGKYFFDRDLLLQAQKKKILYIEMPDKVSGNAFVQKKFYLLDGSVSLEAYTL
jgi:4-amino-4-deoxy-L-arabinose transferase-like glycosyltransferase